MATGLTLYHFQTALLTMCYAHYNSIITDSEEFVEHTYTSSAGKSKKGWDSTSWDYSGGWSWSDETDYKEQGRFHPLDPLTELEINMTSSIIQKSRKGDWLFTYVGLKEPSKSKLLPYFLKNAAPRSNLFPRKSLAVVVERRYNQIFEVLVNLDLGVVENWTLAPSNANTAFTLVETLNAESILRQDERIVERCLKLGWTNMSLVTANLWPMGYIEDREEFVGRRLMQMYVYGKNFEEDNQYAHPFDFLPVIDLNEGRIISIEELPTHDDFDASNKQGTSVPRATANYRPELRDANSFREDLRPVNVSQRNGTSFTITGNEIEWQKFKMRIGYNGREGLVLYNVNYNDNGNVRPLFYRMSLAETYNPYGDPRPPYHRKGGFDETQFGLGFGANQLEPQIDCVGNVEFIDFVINNEMGTAKRISRAVCVREEEAGFLWKHTDFRSGTSAVVRSQRLAMTFVTTVGNYEYIYTWNFYQDATIEFNVKLTGILSVNLLAVNATPAGYGHIVFPQVNAQYHQHHFTLRLDAEIDGNENSVVVSDVVSLSNPTASMQNPYGQGFTVRNTLLSTAGGARTRISPENSRTWHIRNSNVEHPYTKQPVAWKLMPWPSPPILLKRDSPLESQAEWFDYSTWVTPYKENQLFPGGYYLNNSGLAEWVGQDKNANIDNTDIVLWHNFGISHIPRVEDHPVMPVETCGVTLKPVNFFKENPALDVLPPNAVLQKWTLNR